MNIEISTDEYRDLLDILHIADVVLSGHRRENDKRTARHRALIQKLYSLAGGEGLEGLIGRNEANRYVPTPEFEEGGIAHAAIDGFVDHLFWDQLIERLSVRDAAQMTGGIDRFNALGDSEREALEGTVRERYVQEFSANGVANLEVVERFVPGVGAKARTSD